jgi:hypothetical protein
LPIKPPRSDAMTLAAIEIGTARGFTIQVCPKDLPSPP